MEDVEEEMPEERSWDAASYAEAAMTLLTFAATAILVLFWNFVRERESRAKLVGLSLEAESIHFLLGPLLIFLNGALLVYMIALLIHDSSPDEITKAQTVTRYGVIGPLLNPYWAGGNRVIGSIGFAVLIVLWWLGLYAFMYSASLRIGESDLIRAWELIISGTYLFLGLASMLVIQLTWHKWGFDAYRWKQLGGFFGIAIGAIVPWLLLGSPKLRLW